MWVEEQVGQGPPCGEQCPPVPHRGASVGQAAGGGQAGRGRRAGQGGQARSPSNHSQAPHLVLQEAECCQAGLI